MTATGYDFLRISLNDAPIITTFDDIPGLATNRHYVCLPNNPRMKFAIRSTIDGSLRIVCVGNVPNERAPGIGTRSQPHSNPLHFSVEEPGVKPDLPQI